MLNDRGNIKRSMKKIFGLLTTLLLLNGCAESVALLGSSIGGASSGKIAQSSFQTAVSYGVKKQTGKTAGEHAIAYVKKNNPQGKEEKCVNFLDTKKSKLCTAVKKEFLETKEKIFKKSKIEDLALKSIQKRRR